MITINAIGDLCPLPVVKAKKAIEQLQGEGQVEVLVDNQIAVENIQKMADQKGYQTQVSEQEKDRYQVILTVGATQSEDTTKESSSSQIESQTQPQSQTGTTKKNNVVVISSGQMGTGNDELGKILMKGFIYALSQQDMLPSSIVFYNGGAPLTCEGSESLEDIKELESKGVVIETCGTCLDYYGLKESLRVGSVTNLYAIAEKLTQADGIIRP